MSEPHRSPENPPSPKDALCQVWLKLTQWFWRRRFLNFINVFSLFRNLPWEKDGALHLNKIESTLPKDALCQVWLKKTPWFWRRFLNVVLVFLPFCYYFPLEKSRTLHLNQNESSSPKDALCKVWLIMAQQFWRRRFFNFYIQVWLKLAQWFWRSFLYFINIFSLFRNNLPLEKGMVLHLKRLERT